MSIPTVTVGDVQTPTQQVVADANRIVEVTDARGRVIGVRRISMNVRRRVFKAISAEQAEKTHYLNQALLAACVVTIDGQQADPLAGGGAEIVIDAMIDRLDDDGFAAVGKAIRDNFSPPATKDELKN